MSDFAPHRARKRFGQNFLHDPGVINNILRAVAPREGQHLVEIGPGQGAITEGLLGSGAKLDVVELDHDLHPLLLARFGANPTFQLHKGDALKFDFSQLAQPGEKLRIVGNLPYNISTPLMFHLLKQADCIADMHFMLQKEVVQRLAAGAGMNHYGRLGIMVQYHCRVEHLFDVGPGAFKPAPKVDSAIVRLTPHAQLPHPADDPAMLELVVREAFNQRRKTLRNTLKPLLSEGCIAAEGLDPTLRPEQVDLADFVRLANRLTRQASEADNL
jgi:16S rRNA (adenine1518-N6/adenine1519-N6)-dimethyltransferase